MSDTKYDPSGTQTQAACGCPTRMNTPPPPTKLPFPPEECMSDNLEAWIKVFFGSSVFNTCSHQQLPGMTAFQVPLHWQDQVKQDLDRDEGMGIIEKVPDNDP